MNLLAYNTILNNYVHEHIPITQALGAVVTHASEDKVIVAAPFANNINHKSTVFGGSLHAIATISCWGLLYANFIERLREIDLVVSSSHIEYKVPVTSDFEANCVKPAPLEWKKFIDTLQRKRKGRIELTAKIYQKEILAVDYQGVFAVLSR